MRKEKIHNWGRFPSQNATVWEPRWEKELSQLLNNGLRPIARGAGLCYGDSALHHHIVSTRKLNHILDFDLSMGILTAQAGITLNKILKYIIPRGFFLPVTPGTKNITLGGAIAANIHGKNHHTEGTISKHIVSFKLMDKQGQLHQCSPSENEILYWQTIGGMGLTGYILEVSIKLKKVETSYITQTTIKSKNLDETLHHFETYANYTYLVAWLDCLAKGSSLGRSVIILGEHSSVVELPNSLKKNKLKVHSNKKINIPFILPSWMLNPMSVGTFNMLFYNKHLRKFNKQIVHYDPFFYPLDKLRNWNRLYGKNGFVQYQFVLPKTTAGKEGLRKIINTISESKEGSFLVVLKEMGAAETQSPLSFPREGYTLALDFKVNTKVFKMLERLDKLVERYGGRQYLVKDARMSAAHFQKTYSTKFPDHGFVSNQSSRLQIIS